jgi:hypothetical protein
VIKEEEFSKTGEDSFACLNYLGLHLLVVFFSLYAALKQSQSPV